MPIERLRLDLARLREEIARAEPGDRDALARLEQIAIELQQDLDGGSALQDPAALVDKLEESLTGFEVRHPNLTAIVNNIMVALGSMGV
jgi:hypothetical protein